MNLTELYRKYLLGLQNIGRYRKLSLQNEARGYYRDFSSNDYLALSNHPEMIKATIETAKKYGIGSTGSRLLSGNHPINMEFEEKIAADKKTEAALIFNSGFQANYSTLSALLDTKILSDIPLVFFDKLNHASLYQAVFASKARLIRYNHNNMDHLTDLLAKYSSLNQPKFIITETLFGMDGDFADLSRLIELAHQYKAFLYLDEAHATGIVGDKGFGLSTTINLSHIEYLAMGTFSKALGSSGGYIACSQVIKDYLVNAASGFIYSTASPMPIVSASFRGWELVAGMDEERSKLDSLSTYLRTNLINSGFDVGTSSSHIIPIILTSETIAIEMKEKLLKNYIIVSCIRPPTVPPGSSRLRLALNANHTKADIDHLLKVLKFI